ncbi:hypothetical protein BJ508DRAFT_334270 [Ascobolus immersus RN42]|uniref:Uncharacterized protein n=1 Tax=Ascobolus immersus RN42 TaxID=1160509 RepID=A0A3N4HGP5_ASCIM|nr:hypothetical protein BJ508DRAFT_334270 [Ascobolus immersus RN42]
MVGYNKKSSKKSVSNKKNTKSLGSTVQMDKGHADNSATIPVETQDKENANKSAIIPAENDKRKVINTFPASPRTAILPESVRVNIGKAINLPSLSISEMETGSKNMISTSPFAPVHYLNPKVWSREDVDQDYKSVFDLYSIESLNWKLSGPGECVPFLIKNKYQEFRCNDLYIHFGRVECVLDPEDTRSSRKEQFQKLRLPVLGEPFRFQKSSDIFFQSALFLVAERHTVYGTVSNSGFRHIQPSRIFYDVNFATEQCDKLLIMEADNHFVANAIKERKNKWN